MEEGGAEEVEGEKEVDAAGGVVAGCGWVGEDAGVGCAAGAGGHGDEVAYPVVGLDAMAAALNYCEGHNRVVLFHPAGNQNPHYEGAAAH